MLLLLLGCSGSEPAALPQPPVVVATSFPAWYLAARLAPALDVRCLLPPGEDPQTWQPDGALIASLASADLIVTVGAGYEAWIQTAALPESRVVDLSVDIALIELEGTTHSHGIGGAHSHAGIDPHTWLNPTEYALQARTLAARLAPLMAVDAAPLLGELGELDSGYAAVLSDPSLPKLQANHPAYHYLARHHGLSIPSLDLDPSTPPAEPPVLESGTVLLWETAPSAAVRDAISAQHVVLDPLEQPPADGTYDYLSQSEANIALLQTLLAAPQDGDDSHR